MLQWSRMTPLTAVSDAASRACLRLSATHCGLLRHSASGTVGSMAGVQRSIVLLRDCAARSLSCRLTPRQSPGLPSKRGCVTGSMQVSTGVVGNAALGTPTHEMRECAPI